MALALPGVVESSHFGTPDFRVRGKIFATLPPKMPARVVLKVAPAELDVLVSVDPETFKDVWGGRGVGVDLERVTRREMAELLEDAWKRVAPRPGKSR